jgi:hypothetical protein
MTGGAGEDRYVHPAEGDDPRDIDRENVDPQRVAHAHEKRAVSHPQDVEGSQGTSADAPGFDPSDRDRAEQAALPGEEGQAGAG